MLSNFTRRISNYELLTIPCFKTEGKFVSICSILHVLENKVNDALKTVFAD